MYSILLPLEATDMRTINELPVPFTSGDDGAWGDFCEALRRMVGRDRTSGRSEAATFEVR